MPVARRTINRTLLHVVLVFLATAVNSESHISKRRPSCAVEGEACRQTSECCDSDIVGCSDSKCHLTQEPMPPYRNCSQEGQICTNNIRCCNEETDLCIYSKCYRHLMQQSRPPPITCANEGQWCGSTKMCCDQYACVYSSCIFPKPPSPEPSTSRVPALLTSPMTLTWSLLVTQVCLG